MQNIFVARTGDVCSRNIELPLTDKIAQFFKHPLMLKNRQSKAYWDNNIFCEIKYR